jgi:flavin-dependent dehydrogenase
MRCSRKLKKHPSIAPLIEGGEMKEYAAHLIPEGGFHAVPQVYGDGWMIVGDSGGFVNAVHREGSNLAMTTGRLAAETVIAAKAAGQVMSAKTLRAYKAALDESFVMKDLHKYRDMPKVLHTSPQFFTTYPSWSTAPPRPCSPSTASTRRPRSARSSAASSRRAAGAAWWVMPSNCGGPSDDAP